MKINKEDIYKYNDHYDKQGLFSKISVFAKKAGLNAIYYVLLLYDLLVSDVLSKEEKALVLGALGYFILPIDVVPDLMPGIGFMDDISVLVFVLNQLVANISPEIKNKAKNQLKKWFDFDEKDLDKRFR